MAVAFMVVSSLGMVVLILGWSVDEIAEHETHVDLSLRQASRIVKGFVLAMVFAAGWVGSGRDDDPAEPYRLKDADTKSAVVHDYSNRIPTSRPGE